MHTSDYTVVLVAEEMTERVLMGSNLLDEVAKLVPTHMEAIRLDESMFMGLKWKEAYSVKDFIRDNIKIVSRDLNLL